MVKEVERAEWFRLFVVNGFSHVCSAVALTVSAIARRATAEGLNCKLDSFFFGLLFCCAQFCVATPPVITTFDDLDQAVEDAYDGVTNVFSIPPPGNDLCELSYGYRLFSPGSEIESSTNLFHFSPCNGVPVWTVRIIETQNTERIWLYQGNNASVFRTNSVPSGFDAGQWVEDVYGSVPGWLNASEENTWYARRDRSRVAITVCLVESNNWIALEDAWQASFTNSPPSDPGRISFVGIKTAFNPYVSLQLYTSTNPVPIEIYSATDIPTNGIWSFRGLLNPGGLFNSWYSLQDGGTGEGGASAEPRCFFNAARSDIDADDDGIPDGRELLLHGSYTNKIDSDSDGLTDLSELYRFETDPANPDGDADSVPDGWEVDGGMNPFDSSDIALDPDNDHLYNIHEYWINSDPQVAQTNSYAIADAMKAVDLSISGKTASASINIFTAQDHSNTNYIRNTNCWAYTYDLTCCSPWNSYGPDSTGNRRAGTLISPRHVLFAAHYDQITTNDVLRFVDINNNVIERRLVAKKQHPEYTGYPDYYPDFTVGLLESDVPANQISFAKVLPDDYRDYIGSGRFLPALCLDQEEKALVADLVDVAGTNMIEGVEEILTVFDYPVNSNRLDFSEEIIVGDSGNPAFVILNGQLVLLCVWTYGGPGAGTSVTEFKDDINGLMTDLGGGYQLTEFDLSEFSSLVD